MKDCRGQEITPGDIIVWGYSRNTGVAYVWGYTGTLMEKDYPGLHVGFDVRGPSCEDSIPLEEFLSEYEGPLVIGKLKNY